MVRRPKSKFTAILRCLMALSREEKKKKVLLCDCHSAVLYSRLENSDESTGLFAFRGHNLVFRSSALSFTSNRLIGGSIDGFSSHCREIQFY